MDKLTEKVLTAVRENLPEQVAKEMKDYIENAENNKNLIKSLRQEIDVLIPIRDKYNTLAAEKEQLKAKENIVISKTQELEAKERALVVTQKDLQIQAKDTIINNMFTIMQLFVKNPRSLEIMAMSESKSISAIDSYGSYRNTGNENKMTNQAVEHIETKDDFPNTGPVTLPTPNR